MDNLSCPQEADGVRHIGIPDCSEDVIVGRPGLLFCSHVFRQIGNDISLGLELAGIKRNAPGSLRPERRGMVDIIGTEAGVFDFFHGQVFGELIDDGADHFEMSEFVGTLRLSVIFIQVNSEMASLTDSGAITGMDAREDGVYITYIPSNGADTVTKKLGSPELHIPEWRYVLTGGNTFLRFENPGYSKISIGSYTGGSALSISIEGITSTGSYVPLGGQSGTEYDISDYPAFRIVLSSTSAINGYLRDIAII